MNDLQQEIYNIMDDLHVLDMEIDSLSEKLAGIEQSSEDGNDLFEEPDKGWRRRVSYARRMTSVELKNKNKNRIFKINFLSIKRAELKSANHTTNQKNDYTKFKAFIRNYLGDDGYKKMSREFNKI
jgi:FtsZ-binding cell division protein ZapB